MNEQENSDSDSDLDQDLELDCCCSMESHASSELAYGINYNEHEHYKKIKCISSSNHIICFERYINELLEIDPDIVSSIIFSSIDCSDIDLLRYLDEKYTLKNYVDCIDYSEYRTSLKLVKYLKEEIGVDFDEDFLKTCNNFECIKYALQNNCNYVEWHLKMRLYNFRDKIKKDEWMNEFYKNITKE